MSNIYIQEPPSNGKVLLKTSVGDIDVEVWSKEAPKAARNFLQLCMEGYYDGTGFHRVVRDFVVQGGDPTDTGEGGESVYGAPFKDEFHSRLRFVRRGLVAMANAGPHDNGSQFFFTMAATPELQNKHTIFGKVVGDTLYNMLKLQEVEVEGSTDRPDELHRILSTEVLNNPFDDIVPRQIKRKKDNNDEKKVKSKSKATKNFSLLSFGDEAEDDEEQVDKATMSFRGKSKSSHDLTDDPRLSSVSAAEKQLAEDEKRKKKTDEPSDEDKGKGRPGEEEEPSNNKTASAEEEEPKKKSNSPKEKNKSDSPEDGGSKKRKPDSPKETKHPGKTDSKERERKKSRFDQPEERERKKSPEAKKNSEVVKTAAVPPEAESKKKRAEGEEDGRKASKDEVKDEGRKKRSEPEPGLDSKKRKGEEPPHKDDRKKRSKEAEEDERRKRKGEVKEEEGRKKRKGEEPKEEGRKKTKSEAESRPAPAEEDKDRSSKEEARQKPPKEKEKEKEKEEPPKERRSLLGFVEESKQERMEELKREQRKLQRDIKDFSKKRSAAEEAKVKAEEAEEDGGKKEEDAEENDLLAMVKKERMKYYSRKKQLSRGDKREDATLAMLARFKTKLTTARTLAGEYDDVDHDKEKDPKEEEEEEENEDDISWLRHKLRFEDEAPKAKVIDANVSDENRYNLNDPRNPLNQRRRETSKKAMRDKR